MTSLRHFSSLVVMFLIALFWLTEATAADIYRPYGVGRVAAHGPYGVCTSAWRCGPWGCGWQRICPRVCPGRYSCAPLYGAYGPYGGYDYWATYSYDVGSWRFVW
jgi:hypothetical protein